MSNVASTLMLDSMPMLAISAPSMELMLIIVFGSILPITFFLWLKWWLGSVRDEHPDQVIAEQAKADKAHHPHPAAAHAHAHEAHGHGHGHGH